MQRSLETRTTSGFTFFSWTRSHERASLNLRLKPNKKGEVSKTEKEIALTILRCFAAQLDFPWVFSVCWRTSRFARPLALLRKSFLQDTRHCSDGFQASGGLTASPSPVSRVSFSSVSGSTRRNNSEYRASTLRT